MAAASASTVASNNVSCPEYIDLFGWASDGGVWTITLKNQSETHKRYTIIHDTSPSWQDYLRKRGQQWVDIVKNFAVVDYYKDRKSEDAMHVLQSYNESYNLNITDLDAYIALMKLRSVPLIVGNSLLAFSVEEDNAGFWLAADLREAQVTHARQQFFENHKDTRPLAHQACIDAIKALGGTYFENPLECRAVKLKLAPARYRSELYGRPAIDPQSVLKKLREHCDSHEYDTKKSDELTCPDMVIE